jgi:hypothetical protein
MFGGRTATKGFFQMVWNVRANKNSFAISHLFVASLMFVGDITLQMRNRSVSRILYFDFSKWRSFI